MDVGVVLQTNPPASRVVELARQAETLGFSHVWTFDSHLLWEEPFVIYSQILAATRKIKVGPMVTNPATRDWTVTASLFATLNEMFGNRTICGIGRGDSAVRVLNGRPTTLATLRECVAVVRALANGREAEVNGAKLRFPWGTASRLDVWIAAYGPKALALAGEIGDGFILQLADPDIAAWTIRVVRAAAAKAGRDPASVKFCVAAPAYVGDADPLSLAHQRDQCRWFGGMVGNHVADLVARYGTPSSQAPDVAGSAVPGSGVLGPGGETAVPAALTAYIASRAGYDYNEHGRAGNIHADFVPDEIVDRFCLLGPPEAHIERLRELAGLGVDQFAVYLQHDAKHATLEAYGETVIPAISEAVRARGR
ncbi:TIGR03842 family LLM class F420-dependent oxidoreductase [Parafrankia discariae]|uniref:TIGR03842 family LLM class F420-dependent oxidoreductase n=1 Tax=Parafrankia discariae TaxID=365528 RepID=UPI00036B0D6E|nr:TIGR03842 family LLM class F420-dependent oxidoreductase [Parafrankia discariae]